MKRLLKSTAVVAGGETTAYILSFARGVILARLLSLENFGIASFLLLIGALFDLSSRSGFPQLVVRSMHSEKPDFIGSLNLWQFLMGGLASILSILAIFGVRQTLHPDLSSTTLYSLLALAILPILKGVENLEFRRNAREGKFAPIISVEIASQLLSLCVVYPAVLWFGDYRAAIACLITKYIATTTGTHILARNPYRWNSEAVYFREVFSFCWPMLTNSFVMLIVMQGDQFIVAKFFSPMVLAQFAAASSLVVVPANLLTSSVSSSFLPHFRDSVSDFGKMSSSYKSVSSLFFGFTVAYLSVQILVVAPFTPILYGPAFSEAGIYVVCISIVTAFRMLRVPSAMLSLAFGDSMNQLATNMIRLAFLVPAVGLVYYFKIVFLVPIVAGLAELVCYFSAGRRAYNQLNCPHPDAVHFVLGVGLVGLVSIVGAAALNRVEHDFLRVSLGALSATLLTAIFAICLKEVRARLLSRFGG